MFSPKEAVALEAMQKKYKEEKHETATFHVKHLEFLRWLIAHGKMKADELQPDHVSPEEYERS